MAIIEETSQRGPSEQLQTPLHDRRRVDYVFENVDNGDFWNSPFSTTSELGPVSEYAFSDSDSPELSTSSDYISASYDASSGVFTFSGGNGVNFDLLVWIGH